MISGPEDLLLNTFKNLDKSSAGMADLSNKSDSKPQAPKKPRRLQPQMPQLDQLFMNNFFCPLP